MTQLPAIELAQRLQTIRSVFVGGITGARPMSLYNQAGVIDFLPTRITIIYEWRDRRWLAEKVIVEGPRLRGNLNPKSAHRNVQMYFPDWRLFEAPEWVLQATLDFLPERPQL